MLMMSTKFFVTSIEKVVISRSFRINYNFLVISRNYFTAFDAK